MVGLILAFVAINALLYMGKKLHTAVLAGIILIALFNRMSPAAAWNTLYLSVTSSMFVLLGLIVVLLTGFGNLLKETGSLRIMVEKLSIVISDLRLQLVLLPGLVGLMAFPGGAVFSAPMVEEAGAGLKLDRVRLAVINVMFRHIFYLVFPFYAAFILMGEMSGTPVTQIILLNLPLAVLFTAGLFFFLFRGVKNAKGKKANLKEVPILLGSMMPLLVIVVLSVGFNVYFPYAIIAGTVLALFSFLPEGVPLAASLKERALFFYKGINWSMALSIVSLLVLKDFFEQSGTLPAIIDLMVSRGIPLLVLAVLIPYISGFFTGSHTTAVAFSVPLFMAAVPDPVLRNTYLALIFVSGLAGYVGSPLHMCAILTAEHFEVPIREVIRQVQLITLPIVLSATLYHAFFL